MKKPISIAVVLFVLHTLEEIAFHFWNSDALTISIASFVGLPPIWIYWIVQFVLYLFLLSLLLIPQVTKSNVALVVLGIILLFEFQHPLVALYSKQYEGGLYSGTLLALFALRYWKKLLKSFSSKH